MLQLIKSSLGNVLNIIMSILVVGAVLSAAYSTQIEKVESSAIDNVSGYGWSDNIGWISMNCTSDGTCGTSNYGVDVDTSGYLSGYAWSDNIGWISFNPADVAGCPSGPCQAFMDQTSGVISGWARALAGNTANSGGWDGFISMSGAGYGVTVSGPSTGCTWSGFAWGSTVVGWVDFTGVQGIGQACNDPSGSIVAGSCTIPVGGTSCNANISWDTHNLIGTASVLQGASQFSTSPSNPGVLRSVTPSDNSFTLRDTTFGVLDTANAGATCFGTSVWAAGSCMGLPSISLSASPNIVRSGETASIKVDILSIYDLNCTLYGTVASSFFHTGSAATTSASYPTKPLTSAQIVRVECEAVLSPLVTGEGQVRVDLIPTVQEN